MIDQFPQFGNTGVENFIADRQHTGTGAFFQVVEPVGHHDAGVGPAVAVIVAEPADPVVVLGIGDRTFAEQLFVIIDAILDRLRRQIGQQPLPVMPPVVRHASVLAKGFTDVHATFVVDVKRDDVRGIGFSRPDADLPALGDADCGHRLGGFAGRFGDFRGQRLGGGIGRRDVPGCNQRRNDH